MLKICFNNHGLSVGQFIFQSIRILSLALLVGTSSGRVQADVIFRFDLDPLTPGIQDVRDVTFGQTFGVDLLMDITGANTVSAFSVGSTFDTIELSVTAAVASVRPAGFAQVTSPIVINNLTGQVRPFDALSLGTPLDSTFSGLIGTLTLMAANVTNNDTVADLTPAYLVAGIDNVIGGDSLGVPLGVVAGDGGVFFQTARVNIAVPEPNATLIWGIGVIGVAMTRRRRQ